MFLQRLRKAQAAIPSADPVEPRKLADYPPAHRSALMDAISAAIGASSKESDEQFLKWTSQKVSENVGA